MSLSPNTQLSRYKIIYSLGAGGMGEVEIRSNAVSLKLLPEKISANPDGLNLLLSASHIPSVCASESFLL